MTNEDSGNKTPASEEKKDLTALFREASDIKYAKIPEFAFKINIFGIQYEFAKTTTIISLCCLAFLLFIWKVFGLIELSNSNYIMASLLLLQFVWFAYQIYITPGEVSILAIEEQKALDLRQQFLVLLGSLTVFIAFYKNLDKRENSLLIIAIILLCFNIMETEVKNVNTHVRKLRLIKSGIYSVAVFLFIAAMILILQDNNIKGTLTF